MSTATDLTIFTDDGYATALKIAETLVKSGILPRGIDNPFKAFAIIQKGREIGVGPMRALTGIALIEGKPTVSPELKLEQFRQRGGRVKWIKSDNQVAHLHLVAPNGDEHDEIVTMEDMRTAGVAGKDNWKRYPKSMLRARAVGFGLRALGEGDGSYTPDELGAVTNESGEVEYEPPGQVEAIRAAVEQDAPKAAPPAVAPASAATTSKPARAPSIAHDGTFASHKQVTLLHVLKSKLGMPECNGDCAKEVPEEKKWGKKTTKILRCPYHTQLAAFKDCDGKPITTSKDLSEAQISNLIDRYDAKVNSREARAAEGVDLDALPKAVAPSEDALAMLKAFGPPTNLIISGPTTGTSNVDLTELRAELDKKGDEKLVEDLCETLRVMSVDDIKTPERAAAALAIVMAYGTKSYEAVKGRIVGRLEP